MKGGTHLAAGAVTGLILASTKSLPLSDSITILSCSLLGSLAPDVDNTTSKLGRHIAPASFLIQLLIGHRTMFHAPLFWIALLTMITGNISGSGAAILGFSGGVVSHLILDLLNPKGIPLLWPWRKRFALPVTKSGGLLDRLIGAMLWMIFTILLLQSIMP